MRTPGKRVCFKRHRGFESLPIRTCSAPIPTRIPSSSRGFFFSPSAEIRVICGCPSHAQPRHPYPLRHGRRNRHSLFVLTAPESERNPRRFAYCGELIFQIAVVAYFANRFVISSATHSAFLRNYGGDLLLFPCAVPPLFWVRDRMRGDVAGAPPSWFELGLLCVLWSFVFEWLGPIWLRKGTADPLDVLAYAAGAVVCGLVWSAKAKQSPAETKSGSASLDTPPP